MTPEVRMQMWQAWLVDWKAALAGWGAWDWDHHDPMTERRAQQRRRRFARVLERHSVEAQP